MFKRILILSLPGIGDTLMATPMMEHLRKSLPHATIEALTMQRGSYEVLKVNPHIDTVFYFPFLKKGVRASINFVLKEIRPRGYDLSITIYPSYPKHYHIVAYLCGAKMRIANGFESGYIRELHLLNTHLVRMELTNHNVINNLRLLTPLGIQFNPDNVKLELTLPTDIRNWANDFWQSMKLSDKSVYFHNGSSKIKKGSEKRLLPWWWVRELIHMLLEEGYNILFNLGPEEQWQRPMLERDFGDELGKRILPISGLSILQVAALIERTGLLIANDSGVTHLGAALNVRVIGLFGVTATYQVAPWTANACIVTSDLPCAPCYTNYAWREFRCSHPKYNPSNPTFPCMEAISIEKVMECLTKLT